jgi:antitoxin ParD1/3/4
MATMNISLPAALRDYVDAQVKTGRYATASDYVRTLVRERMEDEEKLARLNALIEEGFASGVDPRSVEEIFADIRAGNAKAA